MVTPLSKNETVPVKEPEIVEETVVVNETLSPKVELDGPEIVIVVGAGETVNAYGAEVLTAKCFWSVGSLGEKTATIW